MKWFMMTFASVLIAGAMFSACCSGGSDHPTAKHVVLIGTDGFSSDIVRAHPGAFPNIEALMSRGMSSLASRSVLPSSSAVNWATMLMGATPDMHGYTNWDTQTPVPAPTNVNKWGMFPGIFGEIRTQKPEAVTGSFYSWDGIGYLYEKEAVDVSLCTDLDDDRLCREVCDFIENKNPDFTFIAFGEPDEIGHVYGWESEEYFNMCVKIDSLVGCVVRTIDSSFDPKETAIIFSSDHGGIGDDHGGKTMSEMEVPFVIVGPGIPAGQKIEREIMKFDYAPTVAGLLQIEAPDAWRGKSILR